jgi:FHS family L-fucose permease-like MFS transporter
VAIGGMLTNFLESPDVLNAPIETAGKMVALYWGGAMIGRFIGSAVLTRVPAGIVLAFCTVVAALLCLIVSQVGGPTAAYAALSIGLFNSIMFPTIFTLTLERSTAPTSATSGLLVFGIIGGALLPQVAARIADAAGALQPAFIVPMLGYVGLTVFAIAAARTKVRDADVVAAPSPH